MRCHGGSEMEVAERRFQVRAVVGVSYKSDVLLDLESCFEPQDDPCKLWLRRSLVPFRASQKPHAGNKESLLSKLLLDLTIEMSELSTVLDARLRFRECSHFMRNSTPLTTMSLQDHRKAALAEQ